METVSMTIQKKKESCQHTKYTSCRKIHIYYEQSVELTSIVQCTNYHKISRFKNSSLSFL